MATEKKQDNDYLVPIYQLFYSHFLNSNQKLSIPQIANLESLNCLQPFYVMVFLVRNKFNEQVRECSSISIQFNFSQIIVL